MVFQHGYFLVRDVVVTLGFLDLDSTYVRCPGCIQGSKPPCPEKQSLMVGRPHHLIEQRLPYPVFQQPLSVLREHCWVEAALHLTSCQRTIGTVGCIPTLRRTLSRSAPSTARSAAMPSADAQAAPTLGPP